MKDIMQNYLKKTFLRLGLDVRRVSREDPYPRNSLLGALSHVRKLGWQPRTCLDVGAALGEFSLTCSRFFPEAEYLMIEPLEEYGPFLTTAVRRIPHAKHIPAAAASSEGAITVNVHKDLVGSSLYRETEGPEVDGVERTVLGITLDGLCRKHGVASPYLLKIDVQGAELDVLNGAEQVLQECEYVILEVSLFKFFLEGPVFYDVVNFMKDRGFVVYDMWGFKYRPFDRALGQVDIAFVREEGIFRKYHLYATPEQRARQDSSFIKAISERKTNLSRQKNSSQSHREK